MKTRQTLVLSLLLGLLLAPLRAGADSHEAAPKPITWVSYLQSQVGKSNQLAQHLATEGAKIYDGLAAEGHVVTWGVGMPVNHFAGDSWNILEWVTFRDWAAMDAFMNAFMQMQMAKDPAQLAAEQETWYSLVVPGSHHDEIMQHEFLSPGNTRPAYFDLTYLPLKGPQGGALKKLWMEYGVETMNNLQAAGTIGAHGLAMTVVHDGSAPPTAVSWMAMPNLAAQGAVDAAFEASDKARGEEATKQMMESLMSMVDFAGHYDRIVMVTHYGGGADQGGGDGVVENKDGGEPAGAGEAGAAEESGKDGELAGEGEPGGTG